MSKTLKILYAAGPGDVIQTFHYWSQAQDDPSQTSMTFSGQFYDLCTELNAEGFLITSYPTKQSFKQGRFTFENRPIPFEKQSGILYYLGQIYHELTIVLSALKFKADVVVGSNTNCFFVQSLLPRLGVSVVPSLHCVLWTKYKPMSKVQKILSRLNRRFFAKDCLAILSTSHDINQQIQALTNDPFVPMVNYLSTYRQAEFEDVQPASSNRSTFYVLFAGRLETNKGIFDLLAIAKRLKAEEQTNIVFHVCGKGSMQEELQQQVEAANLHSTFIVHGHCNKPELRQLLSLSHVVIVPTQSSFIEGLNQVVVEGILANRPVITSSVCPALHYVREAAVEVPPDDVQAYGDAILKLRDDEAFYEEKRQKCQGLQEQFYSEAHSWKTAVKTVVSGLYPEPGQPSQTFLQEPSGLVELAQDREDAIAVVEVSRPTASQRLDRGRTSTHN